MEPLSWRRPNAQHPQSFGKYHLVAELGHGGMADVFLALTEGPAGFTKLVVIKRIRDGLVDDPVFTEMLVDEARIAARLNHPNTVQTFEVGQVDHRWFLAMEYLDGQPLNRILAARLRGAEVPVPMLLALLAGALDGLHHAHELRDYDGAPLAIVHRDVSPQNVFITYDGQVKVVDFGIAKARGRASQTDSGTIKGKVVYMAPEQAAGASFLDRRADIFSVGVMLWEILTKKRMWSGLDELAVMARLISNVFPESPRTIDPTIPEELDAICMKALAWDQNDRWTTADEMAEALRAHVNASGTPPQARAIGELVAEIFSDRRKQTTELIERGISSITLRSSPTIPSPPFAQIVESADPTAVDIVFTETSRATRSASPSRLLRSRGALLAVVGVVILVGAASRAMVTGSTDPPKEAAPARLAPAAEPSPSPFMSASPTTTTTAAPTHTTSAPKAKLVLVAKPPPSPPPTSPERHDAGAPAASTPVNAVAPAPVRKARVIDEDNPYHHP